MDSFSSTVLEKIQHISESVFGGMCLIVGTSQQVAIRRGVVDIVDEVERRLGLEENNHYNVMLSGSTREGFRLGTSDIDNMYWLHSHRVIMDMSQSEYYNTANTTIILSDSSKSPPGFTLLRLMTPTTDRHVDLACVGMNQNRYISSELYKEIHYSSLYPDSTLHGPCSKCVIDGKEYDFVFCFVSDFWPNCARSWKERCHSWPDQEVVDDIVRNGCHVVAIGSPFGNHKNEEWRVSFSRAEYKLVSAMNHCQFLTYGLLKLFLKEVIPQPLEDTDKLLCSYHIKTIVFWTIQQNTLPHWYPQNLLARFWICFKLLLKWVYEGNCPNFFVPEHNLFLSKMHGAGQYSLIRQLEELYKKGLACLLQSPSVKSYILRVLHNPRDLISVDVSEVDHDVTLFHEINWHGRIKRPDQQQCVNAVIIAKQLMNSPLPVWQVSALEKLKTSALQCTAFQIDLPFMNTPDSANKQIYIADKMLQAAAKSGCISDMLFNAMFYYKTLRYRKAVNVLEMTKIKLMQPYLMYNRQVDSDVYIGFLGGEAWSTRRQMAIAGDIVLYNSISYISELMSVQQSALQNNWPAIQIPLFVMLHFLEFLCYRHTDTTLAHAALDEMKVLVHYDQGLRVAEQLKDISRQIIRICEQIIENL
nr:uncharacterized protein LOC117684859 [Crassostrea gigas]